MPVERGVTIRSGSSLSVSGGQTGGMERYGALTELSEQICSSLMVAHAMSGSDVHHHGEFLYLMLHTCLEKT
jgi:hypothetical protein